jgi:N12 class adenine-specific DNA methylase/tRNA1(Val) A37 N6-methylase TrmN6
MATKKPQPQYLQNEEAQPNWDAGEDFLKNLEANGNQDKPQEGAGILRTAGDMAIKGAQGVVGLGQSAVGLGSLATGGLVGEGMRAIGYDPKRTNDMLGEYLSDAQKASDAAVQKEDTFLGAVGAAVANPRAIVGSVVQSLPAMIAGMGAAGAAARAIGARAAAAYGGMGTEAGAVAAKAAIEQASGKLLATSAGIEGAQTAGQIADDAQAAGRAYSDYAPAALAAGAGTAAIGFGAGKLVGDAATDIATGAHTLKGSKLAKIGKEFLSEGALEEMPQSAQEQYFTNIANGEADPMKGVANAAGMGLVTGGVMGAGMGALHGHPQPESQPVPLADTGPLSRAANAVAAAQAAAQAARTGPIDYQRYDPPMLQPQQQSQELALQTPAENGIDFEPQPDARGALARQPIPELREATITTEAPAGYDNGVDFLSSNSEEPALPRDAASVEAQTFKSKGLAKIAMNQSKTTESHEVVPADDGNGFVVRPKFAAAPDQGIAGAGTKILRDGLAAISTLYQEGAADKQHADEAQAILAGLDDNSISVNEAQARFDAIYDEINTPAAVPGEDDLLTATPDETPALTEATPDAPSVDEIDLEETRIGLEVDQADLEALGEALANDMDPATGKKIASQGIRDQYQSEYENLQASVAAATEYLRQKNALIAPPPAPRADAAPATIDPIAEAANEAATSPLNDLPEPTQAQKEAGNYKKAHVRVHGLDITIENPVGSFRRGVDKDGTPWETEMQHHYGYIKGTVGMDKDHIDVFIGPNHESNKVFIVDQIDPSTGKPDEHKVMLGFDSMEQARAAYQANYADDWTGGKAITETTVQGFKDWLENGNTKKPFAQQAKKYPPAAQVEPQEITTNATQPEQVAEKAQEAAGTQAAQEDAPVAAVPAAEPVLSKQDLNKLTVKDMTDAQLLQARDVFDGGPRAPKIEKEIKKRGLDAAPEAAPAAPAQEGNANNPGTGNAKAAPGEKPTIETAMQEGSELRAVMEKDTYALPLIIRHPLEADAQGVIIGAKTSTDRVVEEGGDEYKELYDGFNNTRDYLRNTFGDTVTLYRADATQDEKRVENKPTLYFGTKKVASNFESKGRKVKAYDIKVDDIIAAPLFHNGYFDFVVRNPEYVEKGQDKGPQRATTMDEAKAAVRAYFDWYLRESPNAKEPMPGIHGGNAFTMDAGGAPFTKAGEILVNGPTGDLKFKYADLWKEAKEAAKPAPRGVLVKPAESKGETLQEPAPAKKKPTAKQKQAAAEEAMRKMLGAEVGDTITMTFKGSFGYLTSGKPMVIESINSDKSIYFRDPVNGSGTFESLSSMQAAARNSFVKLTWEVQPKAESKLAPAESAPAPTAAPVDTRPTLADEAAKAKAQADLMDGLADLANIFGKNAKLNITPEQEQKLLPVLTKVMDAAFRLGYYQFKDAARFVLTTIREKIGADVAEQITLDHVQGAYIGMAGKYKDQGASTKKEVIGVESLVELADVAENQDDNSAEPYKLEETTPQEEADNDSTASTDSPPVDFDLVAEQRPEGSAAPVRGAKPPRARSGRANDRSVRGPRGRAEKSNDGQLDLGDGAGNNPVSAGQNDAVAGSVQRVSADFRPAIGGLTREGSWFDTAGRNIDLIELAITIEKEGRAATPEEQAKLSKYVGFGASAIRNPLFPIPPSYAKQQDPNRLIWPQYVEPRWKPLAERLDALPREWQKSILQSSQYAHYTSEGMIRSIWSAMQRLGFTGGKIMEPGMGIGSFSMLMPDAVRLGSTYTGIEFDGPTALIAKLLSPDQNMIHGDFIKRKLPRDFFDAAIGNPPFSQTKVLADPDYEKHGFMLHDFFFAKSIDRVRPGGLLAFVTSKGTMDKQADKARKYLAERADLIGAIRLPSTAFEDNAGTSVVTDVIFLRKRAPGAAPAGAAWQNVAAVETKDGPAVINEYFAAHPEMVLGQNRISGNVDDEGRRINSNGMGGEKYTVVSYDKTPAELEAKFAAAIERLPENVYSVMNMSPEAIKAETAKVDFDPRIKRDGVVYVGDDGTLMRVEHGVGKPLGDSVKFTEKDHQWMKSYVGLRDLVQAARATQAQDGDWEKPLKALNKAYDKFRKEHGPINAFRTQVRKSTDEDGNPVETEIRIFTNRRRFREDYDAAIVTQLETINEAGEVVKAPFLLGRTIGKPVTRTIQSIGDALAVSLDALGKLNLADVAKRINLSEEEAIAALGDQVYKTPSGQWQLSDEYLSGDVVTKLEEAEEAARLDPSLKRNVEALKKAQPEKLGPSQISVKLGASWIPAEHVNAFAKEIEAGAVTFDSKTETWQVAGGNERSGRRAGAEYGTAARSPSELLEAALNSRSVKVTTKDADKKTVVDTEATTAANEALKKIKDKFKGWVWTDSSRAAELVESYNKRYNNIAPRLFDGSHLTLPGVSLRFKLHPHQLRAIWRVIQTGNTYLAHAVGAGKTIEMIAAGMEQKRLGLIKKPMYVVPNHMLEQFSNEFMELYPLANIMVADDENFSPERRRAFIASATLNNPDAIIITHDAFQRIGVKEESIAPIRDEILSDLEIELESMAKDSGARVRRGQLEQQIEAVTQRFDRIIAAGGKDSTIKFEDIGADFIFADEAHVYRKLDFHTAQQIKGIDPNGSKRALDMYVKTRYLEKQRPGRSMGFASGTPVTNTMGELYTIMRFFAADELDRAGISSFDAWARMFGEVVPALEPNAAGKYEIVERFARFDNVPELMSRVRQFMDVLTSEHLGALVKRPDLKGGKPSLNIVAPTAALDAYMKGELARRIEASKKWKPSKDEPSNPDPIVAIITDGRFAAIDPRFFGGDLEEGDTSIIHEMADKVAAEYHATADNVYLDKQQKPEPIKGGTQIVFYNLGFGAASQANRGFNARAAFTKRLTDGGVKRSEIAWFDDANTDAKKEAIFKAMRAGQIRVLIGSAKKMGTGVNVQKRLTKLHYQDPPWFPADVEQPHGRIIRQGNQNGEVGIDWYTTKGTYQSTMWQMVARKQRFIDQAFTGDKNMRSMDDMGEASLFEQAAAVASGDPRAIQLAGLKQDVERFERLQAAHANEQIAVRSALKSAEWQKQDTTSNIAALTKAYQAIGEKYFAFTAGTVDGRAYDKVGEFGQALKDAFNKIAKEAKEFAPAGNDREIGKIGDKITIRMVGTLDSKEKPTGKFKIYLSVGGMNLDSLVYSDVLGEEVDAVGLGRRVGNQLNGIEPELNKSKRSLTQAETDIVRLTKKMGAPFEYQQEMLDKYGELKRLEEELRQEGLAAAQQAAAQPEAPAVINADGAAPGEAAQDGDVLAYSRGPSPAAGMTLEAAQAEVDRLKAGWENAPRITVVESVSSLRTLLADPNIKADARGIYLDGRIWIVAENNGSPLDMQTTLFHEVHGHAGLSGLFGDDLRNQLIALSMKNENIRAAAAQWRAANQDIRDNLDDAAWLSLSIEEALADMAGEGRQLNGFAKFMNALQSALRAIGFTEFANWLGKRTDAEALAMLANARQFIERGDQAHVFSAQEAQEYANPADKINSAAFRKWFGDSKVVDADGKPLVVYHGTTRDFSQFDPERAETDFGSFFTDQADHAQEYSQGNGGNMMPVYLSIKNPYEVTSSQWALAEGLSPEQARDAGYDGYKITSLNGSAETTWVAFRPEQIKSAISNNGDFDPANQDIRYSTIGSKGAGAQMALDFAASDNILEELSRHDELFRLPKSNKDTVAGIAADNDTGITVREFFNIPGETRYNFTTPDGQVARMTVRKFNPRANQLYSFDLVDGEMVGQVDERPGRNAEEVEGKDDLWLDVSGLKPGSGYGAKIYNIAATYAHNTGKVFIGDPAGLSDDAMRRRPEQMLSSALKFGTTEHLAPHPWQVAGDPKIGVPRLDWVYGDHIGNIQKLIKLNQAIIENAGGNGNIAYNAEKGQFEDVDGNPLSRADISEMAELGLGRAAGAGGATLARHALFQSLLQGEGGRGREGVGRSHDVLESLGQQLRNHDSTRLDSPLRRILYSRGNLRSREESGVSGALNGFKNSSVGQAVDILRDARTLGEATTSIKDMLASSQTFSLLNRTVGTQFHKATKDADFKRVFTAYNQQTDDTAHYAIEAEKLAPEVLQRLDGFADVGRALINSGAKYKADLEAVAKPLFANIEGESGVQQQVFTPAELARDFGLNDKQIGMYQQVRASVDASLERLAQTTIMSMAEAAQMDISPLKNLSLAETARLVKDGTHDGAIGKNIAGMTKQSELHERIDEIVAQTHKLQEAGYMPAMRFGSHAVTVTDPNAPGSDPLHFEMFESEMARNVAAKRLAQQYPGMQVSRSTMNQDRFKMFKGVSPETVELFAKFSGMGKDEAYRDYIALAKSGRSTTKRMLGRKGIAGFSEDVTRVLASFITSNARQSAMNVNTGEINSALASKSLARKGDVQREAQLLHEYMSNPQEEAQRLRGFMFLHFIGGSIASAAVNLTQPVLQTAPYLSQYAGAKTAGIMTAAGRMAATGKITNAELNQAMARARADGIVDPHEIHNLMADASGATLGSSLRMRAITKAWGSFFSVSEAFNRRLTFLAAYQTAMSMGPEQLRAKGFKDAYEFSRQAIIETQGLYSKTNRPNWARGAVGATLFTFKQFSISYIEFLSRLPTKQKMLALGILVLAAGLQGLPFAEDVEDLIDTIGQSMGYNTNTKRALRRAAVAALGEDLGEILVHGLSSQSNIDLQGRLGMGNMLPGTAMFKMSEKDKSRALAELAGPLGGVLMSMQDSVAKVQAGEILGKTGALATMTPVAVRNLLQGAETATTGVYTDTRGRKVQDVGVIASVAKMLGFQPIEIAQESRKMTEMYQDKGMLTAVSSAIAGRWASAAAAGDNEGVKAAMETLRAWNLNNPDTPIRINPANIRRRVQEIRATRAERFIKSTPKSMRAHAVEELG